MFRIAIVNRGEPARRLIHAARDMGDEVRTIALYGQSDADSLFVREADEALLITPRVATVSPYLDYEVLAAALKSARADAAWVGWGFVAEHPAFAELCAKNNVLFIGPSPEAMRRLGDKIEAKLIAEQARVPVAAWSGGPVKDSEEAAKQAERIGYPLMIKATAGGGGRGIRKVLAAADLAAAFNGAVSEARKAFGDGTVFLERVVEAARHVEVQIAADQAGGVWAVGLRDCTLQRRHQKVVEEAPAPFLPEALRAAMKEAAIRLARTVKYSTLGTVEFLYQPEDQRFFFMEMNPRLQVEHPVTELTTGLDLVLLQLKLARGVPLPHDAPPPEQGHAIEVRLCAEAADEQFSPAPGKLVLFRPPAGPGVRVDSGFAEGDTLSPEFDSMIAKIIAYGPTRASAIARLRRALADTRVMIEGGASTRHFLASLVSQAEVADGRYQIDYLDRHFTYPRPRAQSQSDVPRDVALVYTAILLGERQKANRLQSFAASTRRGRVPPLNDELAVHELLCQGQRHEVSVSEFASGFFWAKCGEQAIKLQLIRHNPYEASLQSGGRTFRLTSLSDQRGVLVEVDGSPFRISEAGGDMVRALAPGLVTTVMAQVGEAVSGGQVILLMEAMKTEVIVRAPQSGQLVALAVSPGSQVASGAPLFKLETQADQASERLVSVADAPVFFGRKETLSHEEQLFGLLLGYDVEVKTSEGATLAYPTWLTLLEQLRDLLFVTHPGQDNDSPLRSYEQLVVALTRGEQVANKTTEAVAAALERCLSRYGITLARRGSGLTSALLALSRAVSRLKTHTRIVVDLLGLGPTTSELEVEQQQKIRLVLEAIVRSSAGKLDGLHAVAERLVYVDFELPRLTQVRALQDRQAADLIEELNELNVLSSPGNANRREQIVLALAEQTQPMLGFISRWIGHSRQSAEAVLEVFAHRYYGSSLKIQELSLAREHEHPRLTFVYESAGETVRAVVESCPSARLAATLAELARFTTDQAGPVVIDVLALNESTPAESAVVAAAVAPTAAVIGQYVQAQPFSSSVQRVTVMTMTPGLGRVDYRTFAREKRSQPRETPSIEPTAFSEVDFYHSIHPAMANRFELWRLKNFRTTRLAASEGVYAVHCVAHQDKDDQRLIAMLDVRDMTLSDSPDGGKEYPHAQHLLDEALSSFRDFILQNPKNPPFMNRLVFCLRPLLTISASELRQNVRISGSTLRALGVVKVVVRAKRRDEASGKLVDCAIHFNLDGPRVVRVKESGLSELPIRPLNAYQRRVLNLRRRGGTDPYEIVRMLSPEQAHEASPFGPGQFVEYDLVNDVLQPVQRPYGENKASMVVGLISNVTSEHPSGMRRVMLLGDPSRDMGSLAEPECRRVIAAIDLAEELSLPLEWFPLSSGAAITMSSGTENLDWTARVLRRLIEFTERGGEVNLVVDGINVGAQSYWNAEASMLMHTRGILIMTKNGSMVLTGKKALEFSGGVSAPTNQGIGGAETIMGPNGEAQYIAEDLNQACAILFRYYDKTYRAPGEAGPRRKQSTDPYERDITREPYQDGDTQTFSQVGEIFADQTNPGRKKPFAIRPIMRALVDRDDEPLERFAPMHDAESAVVWDTHLGGHGICLIGIESKAIGRSGLLPGDGPDQFSAGTLFPLSAKKVARALNSASGRRPVVVLANLSGFDGSPESMRKLQLEYGAEIGRAVVNFQGPLLFAVISRYHGGAYVVFSKALNKSLEAWALSGSYASVIGGAPAAAVVFRGEVQKRLAADPRIVRLTHEAVNSAYRQELDDMRKVVEQEKLAEVAAEFDRVHSVERARSVGSLDHIIDPKELRPALIAALARR